MTVVFPPGQTFHMLSVQQTIRTMWHSMMGYPATEPTNMVQGFFNSVPHDRILQALTFTLYLLQEKWGKPWQEQYLQLSSCNMDSSFRVFRGRRRSAARNTRTMHLEDLPALTDFMLRSSFFQSFNVAHSLLSRFREPVWAQLWHRCCAHLLLPPLSSCACTQFSQCVA